MEHDAKPSIAYLIHVDTSKIVDSREYFQEMSSSFQTRVPAHDILRLRRNGRRQQRRQRWIRSWRRKCFAFCISALLTSKSADYKSSTRIIRLSTTDHLKAEEGESVFDYLSMH